MDIKICSYLKKISFLLTLLIFVLFFFLPPGLYSRDSGLKYFKNYSPEEYDEQPQNWAIIQGQKGTIYVANHGGVLEFDGVSWRIIYVPNKTVRSMSIDNSGTIYIGGVDEIGFLAPDEKGSLQYQSLLDQLDDSEKAFSDVWKTHVTEKAVFFQSFMFLFRWESGKMKVWQPVFRFHTSFTCAGKLYVNQEKVGLMEFVGDDLKLIPGGGIFSQEKIYMIASYDNDRMLIGTRPKGFYLYDGKKVVPFPTEVDEYLAEKQAFHGVRLANGEFAVATRFAGLLVIDSRGKLKKIFDRNSGLLDNTAWYVSEDVQGNLWLALNNGIAKIEYASPIMTYNERSDLPGIVLSVVRHGPKKDLYAGTTAGLFHLSVSATGKFVPVHGLNGSCWSLLSTGEFLLAATTEGVFQVEKSGIREIFKDRSYVLRQSIKESGLIWAGTHQGLTALLLREGLWEVENKYKNITEEIMTIVEDQEGHLWLGTRTKGVIKVNFPGHRNIDNPVVTRFACSHGLPAGEVHVQMAAGHVMFATQKGIFLFDEKKEVFLPDLTFGREFANGSRSVFRIVADRHKHAWFHSLFRNFRAIPDPDGFFNIERKSFLRMPKLQVNDIYPDPDDDIIWFAGNYGLVRYDAKVKKNVDLDFFTLIREVSVNGTPLFYDARKFGYKTLQGGYWKEGNLPVIPFKDRNIRFEFAAPFFEAESQTKYQCRLDGYDKDWSTWTTETKKDYTNIDSGLLRFRVRAKNVYENISKEAVFKFRVLPPWYKTWWAFLCYVIFFFLLMFFVVRWRSGKLEKDKKRLERIVHERTKEIEVQSEKLREMDKVKSRFFANISHEFRTPLTLIMGPMEHMLSECSDREQRKILAMMLRNSRRLLGLINQLLDLSRLDSGRLKLQASRCNIVSFLKGIVASFEILAERNKLDLAVYPDRENFPLYFDPRKLEEVFYNLLINAVKFTPPGGSISVTITETQDGYIAIKVRDSGIGIPREQLDYIFDRFYQVEGLSEQEHKGSGLGLALTKELVNLHHGEITVNSREGEGTEFIIRLPKGKKHLKPEEMVVQPEESYRQKATGEIAALFPAEKEGEEVTEYEGLNGTAKEGRDIILLVEDSTDMRSYIRGALEPAYQILEAKDGVEGIEKAKAAVPDLVVSDIMMPGIDGYEVCRVLKGNVNTSHIPVILLTAKVAEENIVRGLETGADDYITKPFSTRVLAARIKNLIELRRQLQLSMAREMTLQPTKLEVSQVDKEFISDLQKVVEKNLADPDFSIDTLTRKLYIGRTTLYRKIQALSGTSPTEFLRSYRLKRAAELLKSGFGSVTEVAFEVGFSSRTYFTRCFKEKFHCLPSDYAASAAD